MKLPNYIEILKGFYSKDFNFLDIGAYRGSVTANLLEEFPNAIGMLFEPTPESFNYLIKNFSDNTNLKLFNLALSDKVSESEFYLCDDGAQNSLLNTQMAANYNKTNVKVELLDDCMASNYPSSKIDFIKIDTQGNDLNVLKGGINIIKKYMPVILTEIIFIPLYKNQGNYYEQLDFMDNLGYKIAGIYDVHYHESGVIAYADFLFLSKEKFEKLSAGISTNSNFVCRDVEIIFDENKKLKLICQERLDLINNLSEEAGKRLDIINSLTQEIKRLQGQK